MSKSMSSRALWCCAFALGVSFFAASPASSEVYTVISTADTDDGSCDTGHCTLREAIQAANAHAGLDTVAFDLPGPAPYLIQLASGLPSLTDPVLIDGTSEPDYAGTPVVEISGTAASSSAGVLILADGTTVRGLSVGGFGGIGVYVYAADDIVIEGNHIGVKPDGVTAVGNSGHGINLLAAKRVTVADNLISSNGGNGISCLGSSANPALMSDITIAGNRIGTTLDGLAARPNAQGMTLQDVTGLIIGGASAGEGNLISGNTGVGVSIYGSSLSRTVFAGNFVGVDATGLAALPNGGYGVRCLMPQVDVGGTTPGAGNVISGNPGNGLEFRSAGGTVAGNMIGVGSDGATPIGNYSGIYLRDDADGAVIGGSDPGARNVISGNGYYGIYVYSSGPTEVDIRILGNCIGTDASGATAVPNGWHGIFDGNIAGLVIGEPGAGNIISGNGRNGIELSFGENRAYPGVFVRGNRIGTDASGAAAIPNQWHGIEVTYGVIGLAVGGAGEGDGNLISGNLRSGIHFGTGSEYVLETSILGNGIGVNAVGGSLGNGEHGIHTDGYVIGVAVGGVAPGEANEIAHNAGAGVRVENYWAYQVDVTGNAIHDNGGLGIDLLTLGVTANDYQDADRGSNETHNFPVLTSARQGGGSLAITGDLETIPFQRTRVDVYGSPAGDPSGYGEGATYLGTTEVRTNILGQATLNLAVPSTLPAGSVISATAADSVGNTSEFGSAVVSSAAVLAADLGVSFTAVPASLAVGRNDSIVVSLVNDGPDPSSGVVLELTVSGTATVIGAQGPRGTVTVTPGSVVFQVGSIAPDETLEFVLSCLPDTVGPWSMSAAVSGFETDPLPGNDTAMTAGETITSTDVFVALDGPPFATEGTIFERTVTVGNDGPSPASRIELIDLLGPDFTPAGLTYDAAVCSCGFDTDESGVRLVCAITDLPVGGATDIIFGGSYAGPGTYVHTASAVSISFDPNIANNEAAAPVSILSAGETDLTVRGTSPTYSVVFGLDAPVRFVMENLGPATSTAEVTVQLGTLMTFEAAAADMGSAVHNPGLNTILWTLPALAPGDSAILDLTLRGADVRRGLILANVVAPLPDPVGANDWAEVPLWIKPVPTLTVNSSNDVDDGVCDGAHCSLREAINAANAAGDRDIIAFAIPDTGEIHIRPLVDLPLVSQPVVIDGTYQPTYSGSPVIGLTGDLVAPGGTTAGLVINASDTTVRGLVVGGFPGSGLFVYADRDTVAGNRIGIDHDGLAARPNGGDGLWARLRGGFIGGLDPLDVNVISGNAGNGIVLNGSSLDSTMCSYVLVEGNLVGTDAAGTFAIPNQEDGLKILWSSDITAGVVGNDVVNIFSGNAGSGVAVSGENCARLAVIASMIGTDAAGAAAIPNQGNGIETIGVVRDLAVGGVGFFEGNVISGNGMNGVSITGSGSRVQGNIVGLAADRTSLLPNGRTGIAVLPGADPTRDVLIGGASPRARNYVSGNTDDGISVWGDSTHDITIQNNWVGVAGNGTTAVPNGGHGVAIHEASAVVVGGDTAIKRNILSGNAHAGLHITGGIQVQDSLIVQGNYIGCGSDGMTAVGNAWAGIYLINEAKRLTIGGAGAGLGNVISGNGGPGVWAGQTVDWIHSLTILGNRIGVDIHEQALPNAGHGIWFETYVRNSVVGDGTPAGSNEIAHNQEDGIRVQDHGAFGIAMIGNRIHDNGGLAIDLETAGPDANDPLDVDRGANERQNYPLISGATAMGDSIRISGSYHSLATADFRIDFYADRTADPSGHGEALVHLGSLETLSTDASGNASFDVGFVLPDTTLTVVCAAATEIASGNSSELGAVLSIVVATSVEEPVIPLAFRMGRVAPNPFNPRTSVAFDLPRALGTDVGVYDLRGQLVRTLLRGERLEAGHHRLVWDGMDDKGRTSSAGTYFIVVRAGDYRGVGKAQLVK